MAVVGVLTVAAILALNLYAPANPTPAQRLLASLLLACCALPTLMWASNRQWPHSFMPLLGTTYALYFVLPIFLRTEFFGSWIGAPPVDAAMITTALILALAGWGSLLLGYFGPVGRWASRKLPRIGVLSTARVPNIKAFAVTLGLVAALFLYLDKSNVSAFYTGQDLLTPALVFPVIFIGETIVLSILIFFYLHRRGELDRAGKSFLWGLVTYYTVLGLSTGLMLHGLSAIVALYVSSAIATPVLTWRIVSTGVLIAAILLFVGLPVREYLRIFIWTHGIDVSTHTTLRKEVSVLSPEDIATGHAKFVKSSYDMVFKDNSLRYTFKGDRQHHYFFLHIYPVEEQPPRGSNNTLYENHDFFVNISALSVDHKRIHHIKLPPYDIKYVKTGILERRDVSFFPAEAGKSKRVSRRKALTSFTLGSWRNIDTNGEWRLGTDSAAEWKLSPYPYKNRLIIGAADARERNELMSLNPGDRIRVVADTDNWGEYRLEHVSRSIRKGRHRFQVAFRLQELTDSAGSPSSLRRNGPAYLLYNPLPMSSIPPLQTSVHQEKRSGPGRNPWASEAHASQARRIMVMGYILWDFVKLRGDVFRHVEFAMDRMARRTDMLLPLAWIIGQTPENIPYLCGESYTPLLFKLLPRIVFPDKPTDMRDFGQRYGFVPKGNDVNAFKPHQVGEFYANFGSWGILLGTFALGILYRAVYAMFFYSGASVMTLAAGTHILTILLVNLEATASTSWGFVIWYCFFLFLLQVTVQVGWSCGWRRPN